MMKYDSLLTSMYNYRMQNPCAYYYLLTDTHRIRTFRYAGELERVRTRNILTKKIIINHEDQHQQQIWRLLLFKSSSFHQQLSFTLIRVSGWGRQGKKKELAVLF